MRPRKATVDYFPHFVNHGKTMFTIENKYGNDGYAFCFKLYELLGSSEQHYLDCNDVETWEFLLAKTRLNGQIATEILTMLSKLGSIDKDLWDIKVIRSDNLIKNLEAVYKRRSVSVISNTELMNYCIQKHQLNGVSVNKNPQRRVKESIVKESIKKKGKIFTPPELSEVIEYFKENGYKENTAVKMFNSYSVANWHDSQGKPVRNWKQKAINVWFKDENKYETIKGHSGRYSDVPAVDHENDRFGAQ
jgi:hypothetical protein